MSTTYADADPTSRPFTGRSDRLPGVAGEDHGSAVSWGAIFAGAAGAAALSLILLVLGTGLGLSSVSPWASKGVGATTLGVGTIVWILFMAIAASGVGGYLAGRLRSRWVSAHTDEVYFRDTAHGFLAWAVATLVTAALLTSTIGAILGAAADAGGAALGATGSAATVAAAGGAGAMAADAKPGSGSSSQGYFTDMLLRPVAAAPAASGATATGTTAESGNATASTGEIGRIFARGLSSGTLSAEDTKYVGQVVAQRTGIAAPEAEKRVTDTFAKAQQSIQEAEAKAKDAADKARKAAAYAALWMFISLLLGAFTSSLMATFGGRGRDL